MLNKLRYGLIVAGIAALTATGAQAGSIERMTHHLNNDKCKTAVAPKNLTGSAYKSEMAKCRSEGDAYK